MQEGPLKELNANINDNQQQVKRVDIQELALENKSQPFKSARGNDNG